MSPSDDLSQLPMLDLFRMEVEMQVGILANGLLALERDPNAHEWLKDLMRAAHSLKGAARMVGYDAAVRIAHALEDCFVAAQAAESIAVMPDIDTLLHGVDLLGRLSHASDATIESGQPSEQEEIETFLLSLSPSAYSQVNRTGVAKSTPLPAETGQSSIPSSSPTHSDRSVASITASSALSFQPRARNGLGTTDKTVRITADHLTHLLGLAGESLVNARGIGVLTGHMLRLKQMQQDCAISMNSLQDAIDSDHPQLAASSLQRMQQKIEAGQSALVTCIAQLEEFDRRSISLSERLYREVLASRMRPFAEGIQGLPRMVRDVARTLGKRVTLEIVGDTTLVDRDILQRIETPLGHLLRNVVDHGIESPEERRLCGKPLEGSAVLHARHSAGALLITITDDGRGVDPELIRRTVIARNLATPDMAARLGQAELLEFLFLPGFSLKDEVTDISGRGVGLDVVQTMIREIGGTVEVSSIPGQGMRVQLQLPITLSVLRALIIDIAGEPYAFPLARVVRVTKVSRRDVLSVEGRQYILLDGRHIGLVAAQHVLELAVSPSTTDDISIVVVGNKNSQYGMVVDRLLGERELVIRPLDPRLGKVADVSAASLMSDGSPVLIIDVDDLIRSIEVLISGGRLLTISLDAQTSSVQRSHGRVLVVDDSITVRETERKLLQAGGYQVDVAVDGMDAWNAVRTGHHDLVITDVDMPRMDGIELTKLIRKDMRLKGIPIMIVSYKDREEDRVRGLEAGADYYLTKASFQDDSLLNAAADLIGDEVAQSAE